MKKSLVSVIIVTMNNKEWLQKCVVALLKQNYHPIEIIVIDNGSDDTQNVLAKKFPEALYIKNKTNEGFGKAANRGIRKAKGDYILIYNDDAICDKLFLEILVNEMEKDASLAVCQGTLLNYDKPDMVESIGSFLTPIGILWKDCDFSYKKRKLQQTYIFNANLPLIRKSILKTVGLFDEDYFLYFEEADLNWRIWKNGGKIACFPLAKVWHKSGMTTKRLKHAFVIESHYTNRLNSLLKNLELKNLVYIIPLHLLFCLAASFAFLFTGKFSMAGAIGKAVVNNIIIFKRTIQKRAAVRKLTKVPDSEIFRYGMRRMGLRYFFSTGVRYFIEW